MTQALPFEARYALGRHVFLCVCGPDLVMLDLVSDKYLAIEAREAAGLSAFVRGWPVAAQAYTRAAERESLVAGLLRRGLLTQDLEAGKESAAIELPTVTEELIPDGSPQMHSRPRFTEAVAFVLACLVGKYLRKHRSIEQIVKRVKRRREWHTSDTEFDIDRARRLMSASGRIRSLLLSTRGLCLLEAIVLLEYFARYRLFPTWVFGVQTRPFAAHCWLQHEHIVLNDTVEHVTRYTPIMTV